MPSAVNWVQLLMKTYRITWSFVLLYRTSNRLRHFIKSVTTRSIFVSYYTSMTGVSYRIIMHANNFLVYPCSSILLLFIIESEEIFSKLAKKGEVGSDEYCLRSLAKKNKWEYIILHFFDGVSTTLTVNTSKQLQTYVVCRASLTDQFCRLERRSLWLKGKAS
jgi:hypothetical protein